MRQKLIVYAGLSGSGKSSAIAKEFCSPFVHVFSYDELRKLDLEATPEQLMEKLFERVGSVLRASRATVVVDAVNLHPHDKLRWETVAWVFDVDLEWRELDTPLEVSIAQDAQRQDPVGRAAIERQHALRG